MANGVECMNGVLGDIMGSEGHVYIFYTIEHITIIQIMPCLEVKTGLPESRRLDFSRLSQRLHVAVSGNQAQILQ